MEEIKVGEYGRTNLGNIIKFAWFYNKETNERDKNKVVLIDLMKTETRPFYYFKKEEHIVKHSPNIIDLIEVGDYVNEEEVIKRTGKVIETYCNEYITDQYFETILTKEQYQANAYRLE